MSLILLLLSPMLGLILICSKMQNNKINGVYVSCYTNVYYLKAIALKTSIITLLISLYLFVFYHFSSNYFQFVQDGVDENYFNLSFGLDGTSIYFVLLTTIIIPISLLSNWKSITEKIKSFLAIILLLETLLLSIFLVLDGLLFYVFFESILPPLFILIGIFGSADKVRASFYLFLYTLLGSLFMLLCILKICGLVGYIQYDAVYKSNIVYYFQIFLFSGIFIAFAVKTPTIFLNSWLLKAHVESPLSGSIILAGIVLKLSLYGVFRLMLPLLVKACIIMTKLVYVIGFITIIYGSASTIRTIDVKELIAYSSVCHAAVYLMGVFSNVITGIEGGILLGLAHGFVSSGLFICVGGVLYDRSSTRLITIYRGMTQVMPIYSILFFILCLGNCGVPLTLNFLGEFMSLYGVFERHTLFAPLASLSIILSAAYTIYLFNRIAFAGSYSKHFNVNLPDVNKREFYMLLTLVIFTIVFGVYPTPILDGIHYNVSMLIYNLIILPIVINVRPAKVRCNTNNVSSLKSLRNKENFKDIKLYNSWGTEKPKLKTLKLIDLIAKNKTANNSLHKNLRFNYVRKTKQFLPASKEWYNSTYGYNKNNTKTIPALDINIYALINNYFNLYSEYLENNYTFIHSRRRRAIKERRSINKILVSRPELKHTNDEISVNAYIFDAQKNYFLNKIKKRPGLDKKWILMRKVWDYVLKKHVWVYWKDLYPLKKANLINSNLKYKLLNPVNNLYKFLKNRGIKLNSLILLKIIKRVSNKRNLIYKDFIAKSLYKEITFLYIKQLTAFKNMKFEKKYLLVLAEEIKKLYNKNVNFTFVNLKYLYLNSNIFSTALVTKIKNLFKKNRSFLKAVKKSLTMMNIPGNDTKNLYKDIYKKQNLMQNLSIENFIKDKLTQNTKRYNKVIYGSKDQDLFIGFPYLSKVKVNNMYKALGSNLNSKKDLLEITSLDFFYIFNIIKIFKAIKYKFINGARIEVAGRLNKRKKATRSIFKIRYKGNIRNIDSSDKGISTALLRGHFKSNLQYDNLNSKLQGGSFGTKIFISGK